MADLVFLVAVAESKSHSNHFPIHDFKFPGYTQHLTYGLITVVNLHVRVKKT